jgi:general secretion pathway protein A
MLARPELRQLRQRIALRHHLRPFDERETSDYVEERLRRAGYAGKSIFKRKAIRELYAVTGGTPRLINVVCDGALLLGYSELSAFSRAVRRWSGESPRALRRRLLES